MILNAALLCLVVGVSDGDTLTARCPGTSARQPYQQVKVRLLGIDAPERAQPYGKSARKALSDMVFQKEVRLNCPKTDRYKRHLCTVWVAPNTAAHGPKTLDAGLVMVSQGMAWWYKTYAGEQTPQEREQYAFAEKEARAKRAGLWASKKPVAPWTWRRKKSQR